MRQTFTLLLVAVALLFSGCSGSGAPQAPKAVKPLVVGMDADYPPMTFRSSDGEVQGVEVNFAQALGKELGRPVRIEVLPWAQLGDALLGGGVDIVMSGVSITKYRASKALFGKPYMQISQMAVMKEGAPLPDTLHRGKGMRIGYQEHTTGAEMVKRVFPEATMVPAVKMRDGIIALIEGKTDYFFADSPAVWYYTATNDLHGLMGWYVPYTQENLAWAIAPDNVELKQAVDKIVDKWKMSGFISETLHKWMPVRIVTPQNNQPIHFD